MTTDTAPTSPDIETTETSTAGGATNAEGTKRLSVRSIWRQPLPLRAYSPVDRVLIRSFVTYLHWRGLEVSGVEHVSEVNDPFVFVANHSQKPEAVLVPTVMVFFRRGRNIHFLADWPWLLMPIVSSLYRRSEVIRVMGKSPKLKFLNVFKPLFHVDSPAMDRAHERLQAGASVGIFPEGTVNRDPNHLLRGQSGAAMLAMRAGVPVVPAGIRFPDHRGDGPIGDFERMTIHVGAPLTPPTPADAERLKRSEIRAFHGKIMEALARLSGKQWHPEAKRRRPHHGG
ncbi:MAG: lysophospholipid acyltransferase family protein [Acidobacteriota bacterium]